MKINLTTKKVNLIDSTKEKLEKKLSKFDKILKDDAIADVKFKMENDVVAPRAGTITQVSVPKGATVNTGDTLVVLS